MNVFRSIGRWFGGIAKVFANEVRLVTHDMGVLIFFMGLPLLYPIVYTLIYNPEVVNDIPVAVVDDCRTQTSRDLVRTISAAPAFDIYDYCSNMADAKALMASGEVYAILKIPQDYGRKIGRSETAHAEFFMDMGLLLRYRTFV
ncbi:MAG: ABC transporter permease, partial [Muribaculaceae bacterium]|nr:ABC transporter permease [Muribaculaceae bacterium]